MTRTFRLLSDKFTNVQSIVSEGVFCSKSCFWLEFFILPLLRIQPSKLTQRRQSRSTRRSRTPRCRKTAHNKHPPCDACLLVERYIRLGTMQALLVVWNGWVLLPLDRRALTVTLTAHQSQSQIKLP